jgi:membrane protein DedA with SNARE-associated domain
MADIFEIIAEYSYFGIFFLLVAINTSPILMPPSWMVLSSFLSLDPTLDILILAAVGATGATIGKFVLKRTSHLFRRFVGQEQKSNLDFIGNFLNRKKFGYILTSFLFAATPLPDSMLFVAYGLIRAKSIGLYVGFWFGRLLSYYIMLTISNQVLDPFLNLFGDRLTGILIADVVGMLFLILFSSINWNMLFTQKKLKLIKPKIWRF